MKICVYLLLAEWYSSFYWRDYAPVVYSKSKKKKILSNFRNTCGLPNCNSELKIKDAQFLHIKQYEDYNQDEDGGLVICNHCSDRIMDKTKSAWIMLTE